MDFNKKNIPVRLKDKFGGCERGSSRLPDSAAEKEGCTNKRHAAAPMAERRQRPHSHQLRGRVSFRSVNKGKLRGPFPLKYPISQPVQNISQPMKKDVEISVSNMQDMSHPAQKRKHHHHGSDRCSSIGVGGSSPPHSEEAVISLASHVSGEDEGVATSCKRIKVSTQKSGWHRHISNAKFKPQSRSEVEEGAGCTLEQTSLDFRPNKLHIVTEKGNQVNTVSRKRAAVKHGSPECDDFLGEDNLSPSRLSNYRLSAHLQSEERESNMLKMVKGPRKTDKFLGGFKPHNSLKHNSDGPLHRRSATKAFNLVGEDSQSSVDGKPTIKRRKLERNLLPRRESSNSVTYISGEGSHVGTVESSSSLGFRPTRAEQGVNCDTHRRRDVNVWGSVPEYAKTEALISFPVSKARKSTKVQPERISPLRGIRSHHDRPSRLIHHRDFSETPTNSAHDTKASSLPAIVQNDKINDIQEGRPSSKIYQSTVNGTSENADAPGSATQNLKASKEFNLSKLNSSHFEDAPMRNETDTSEPQIHATISRDLSLDAPALVPERPTGDSRRQSSTTEDDHSHDDSIDLLDPDWYPTFERQGVEVQIPSRKRPRNFFTKHKSQSISTGGDIPQSSITQARPRTSEKPQHISSCSSFNFMYLKSGITKIAIQKGCEPWQLQYNKEAKIFDILANGESISAENPLLIIKPDKLVKATYHDKSGKVHLTRRKEIDFHSGEMIIFVEMQSPSDGVAFVECLQHKNQLMKTFPAESPDYMNKIFTHNEVQSTTFPDHTRRKPLDVALLEKKEARLAAVAQRAPKGRVNIEDLVPEAHTANIGRQVSITVEDETTTGRHQKHTLASNIARSVEEEPLLESRSSRTLPSKATSSQIFLRPAAMNAKDLGDHRPSTRASHTRQQNSERTSQSPKLRSPSPIGWTERNPNWMEDNDWKNSLVFPAEGRKQQAMVVAEDIVRLDAGNFLNDNLIALYLRYLEDRLEKSNPELAQRIYFQNTFFYASLTKGKVRSNNINYDAVKRWSTKAKVDIFSFDYIVVPVNENLHWYVAIICNAPKLLRGKEGENEIRLAVGGQAKLDTLETQVLHAGSDKHTLAVSKSPDTRNLEQVSADPGVRTSASPSVTVQVEQMSLEDSAEDWPESDAMPHHQKSEMVRLEQQHELTLSDQDIHNAAPAPTKDLPGQIRAKKNGLRRKSMPATRKYNKGDPRIITLDSLGGSHSPTCSNLLEYLVCEGRARHNIEIEARRLGMTAKGLPQQTNLCDCGIFVLGYMEKFLKDPDKFVQDILVGDMAPDIDWDDMNAPKMRENIRELIFQLQRKQVRREHQQQALRSQSKRAARVEAPISESSNPPARVTKSTSTTSSKAVSPVNLSIGSIDLISPRMPAVMCEDDDEMDHTILRAQHNTKYFPVEIEDEDVFSIPKPKTGSRLNFRGLSASKEIRPKAGQTENRIVEPSTSRSQDRKTVKPISHRIISSNLDIEPGSASMTTSLSRFRAKSEELSVMDSLSSSRDQNIFKRYRKEYFSSPYQNTRKKLRYGSTKDGLANDELNGLEIPESPLRQATPDDKNEEISELLV